MSRLLTLALCACGGFNTPEQPVALGLAVSSAALPPRLEQNGDTLVVSRVHLAFTASVRRDGPGDSRVPLGAAQVVDAALDQRWLELQVGPLSRGDYAKLELDITELTVDGAWNSAPFHLVATDVRARDVTLPSVWRVVLGRQTAVALQTDPVRWLAKVDSSQRLELIDPADSKAASELTERFFSALAAVRDDDRDGIADPP